jgi:hypothetical protein
VPIQEGSRSLATDKIMSNHVISTVALIGLKHDLRRIQNNWQLGTAKSDFSELKTTGNSEKLSYDWEKSFELSSNSELYYIQLGIGNMGLFLELRPEDHIMIQIFIYLSSQFSSAIGHKHYTTSLKSLIQQ